MAILINDPPPPVSERPKCPNCDAPLRPLITEETARDHSAAGFKLVVVSRTWDGAYHGYGSFCTLRCCASFANAAFKAGYRRTN